MKKIIVLGGGIGGVEAAISMSKRGFDVELISNRDFLFIYPLAIWIPTGEISMDRISLKLKDIASRHKFRLTIDEVTSVNAASHSFTLKNSGVQTDFDYLVLALGAHKVPHKGKEYVLSICGDPDENLWIQQSLNALIEKGAGRIAVGFGGNPKDQSGVRGGPAFEFLFNVHHFLKKRGLRKGFDLTFFAPMDKPGIRLGEKALGMMDTMFRNLNIHQRTGKKISEFIPDGVVFEDGSKLESDMTMFIPAGDGHGIIKASDLPQNEAGFVLISSSCEVQGYPWIYAVGDTAALEGPAWKAKQGHLAESMARTAAHDIALKEGKVKKRKSYLDHLSILCVMDTGNGAAMVYRNNTYAMLVPMPMLGHWLKKAWGLYYKLTKLKIIPRIPGI